MAGNPDPTEPPGHWRRQGNPGYESSRFTNWKSQDITGRTLKIPKIETCTQQIHFRIPCRLVHNPLTSKPRDLVRVEDGGGVVGVSLKLPDEGFGTTESGKNLRRRVGTGSLVTSGNRGVPGLYPCPFPFQHTYTEHHRTHPSPSSVGTGRDCRGPVEGTRRSFPTRRLGEK